ncbi:MAG: glycoside hydrolase family 32 protein [Solobacterium sp.]|nr:glycoside hydrolase family 32 protein [Solobacterium sp.]
MKKSYRQFYHANVLSGWGNDPNGTIFYNGKAHLFFQHYPYKPEWGIMHWGHFVTEDFIHWENLPLALEPLEDYEEICGCCSGSAIEKDGKLYLMYTAAQPELQRQCIAVSEDGGIHFEKDPGNPIVTADQISPEIAMRDFRDPRVFLKDGVYYMLAGARVRDIRDGEPVPELPARKPGPVSSPSLGDVTDIDPKIYGYGNLVLLKSDDLYHWSYVGKLLYNQEEYSEEFYHLNGVYECPDYFVIDGTEVVLASPQNLPQTGNYYQNIHSGLYMLGNLDFETGRFQVSYIGEADSGFDFYAAQTLRMPDDRVIMIAWKEMWDRSFPTREEGWAGTYTLPRELSVEEGRLIQKPVREIKQYRKNHVSAGPVQCTDACVNLAGISGNVIEIKAEIETGSAEKCGLKVFCSEQHETLIYYDRKEKALVFDRSRSGIKISGKDTVTQKRYLDIGEPEKITLDLFLDVCSLEVFVDGGKHVMTGNVYPDIDTDIEVRFFAENGTAALSAIEKYDICV